MSVLASMFFSILLASTGQQADSRLDFLKAVQAGDQQKVESLLKQDPTLIHSKTKRGSTVLQVAGYAGQEKLVPLLESKGADLDFGAALAINDLAKVRALLKADAGLASKLTPDGYNPLCIGATRSPELVTLLLQNHASIEMECRDFNHVRPIHSAVFGRKLACVKLIVEAGADVNAVQEGNFTPMDESAGNGDLEIIKYLIAHGAKPDIKSKEGKTAKDYAGKHPDVVKFLSAHGG